MFWRRKNHKSEEGAFGAETGMLHFEKFGETLTPNMRALRLTVTVGEVLLSMGVAANSVVSKTLDITDTYCKSPVHIDVSSNVIMLSQLRGVAKEPLTLMRPVSPRSINYMTMHALQGLIHGIREGEYSLEAAENELERILSKPKEYPQWLVAIGQAGIPVGISLMFTRSWRVVLVTFIVGMLIGRLLHLFSKKSIPPFFRQVGAALFATLAAAFIAALGKNGVSFFAGMNPTLIVVGGIIMLVAGLLIVGAIQDAIEEYYLTAAARILKVGMLTVGIVTGILIGLYTARKLGHGIAISPNPLQLNALQWQLAGAAIAAAAYSLSTHTPFRAIGVVSLIGPGALAVSYFSKQFEINAIAASGVAAIAVGFMASIIARVWRTPSAGIIAAGIIPLVPGLALYNGLMQLINYPPGDPDFALGLGTFFGALAIALSIAAGATFGNMISRPLRQKLAWQRNTSPFASFMKNQLKIGRKATATTTVLKRLLKLKKD